MTIPNLTEELSLTGSLTTGVTLTGTLQGGIELSGNMINGESIQRQYYYGSYEVTPTVDSQTISVEEKIMSGDITVDGIPYEEVPNDYGDTVYIG